MASPIPNSVLNKLDTISTIGSYSLLTALGYSDETIYLHGKLICIKDWVKEDSISWLLANQTENFTFWGGPPTHLKYYQGTLYILLLDRIYDYLSRHSAIQLCHVLGVQ